MNIARKALAVAAVAGLGMAGFAATAHADTPTKPGSPLPRPNAGVNAFDPSKLMPGDWVAGIENPSIAPNTSTMKAGMTYTISLTAVGVGNQAKGSGSITFNANPGNGAISCKANAPWATVTAGKISWSDVPLTSPQAPVEGKVTITCTYNRDYTGVVNENIVFSAPAGHVITDANGTRGNSFAIPYTIGGTLPSGSATPKPTTSKAPVKDKDSKGGLAKTGF